MERFRVFRIVDGADDDYARRILRHFQPPGS
jgi:hypothetical protein